MNSTSKIRIFENFWTINDTRKHRNWLFVYGDNNAGIGKGGQAIIRGEPNTIGIPTKKYPSYQRTSFYTDAEFEDNIKRIDDAISKIITESKKYDRVILPVNGFGTGLAKLPTLAPKTYKYLVAAVENMCKQI